MTVDDFFSSGQYALIDLYYKNVWINVNDENIAHEIRQVFWPKAVTVVFDLSCFSNYTETLVDSDVALNWSIEACTDLLSPLTAISFVNPVLTQTQKTYTSKMLINHAGNTLLSKARQKDLQNQMLFYVWFLKQIKWNNTEYNDTDKKLFVSVRQIVQTEIHLESIKKELIKLAGVSITGSQCLATTILRCLDSLYD
jgi:hypothetical protein